VKLKLLIIIDLFFLFLFVLYIVQKFLVKQKLENCGEDCDSSKLKELTAIYVKIIDKLFLTKAFTDIQNSHMAKLRNSVYDKNQIVKQQQENGNSKEFFNDFFLFFLLVILSISNLKSAF
jgi:hypothetical protein